MRNLHNINTILIMSKKANKKDEKKISEKNKSDDGTLTKYLNSLSDNNFSSPTSIRENMCDVNEIKNEVAKIKELSQEDSYKAYKIYFASITVVIDELNKILADDIMPSLSELLLSLPVLLYRLLLFFW